VPVVKKKVTASFNRAAIGKSFRSQAALVLAGVCVDLGSELCVGWGGGLEGEGWGRGGRGGRGGGCEQCVLICSPSKLFQGLVCKKEIVI